MNFQNLPINAFDVALVVVLFAGVMVGRKRGMSEELMNMVKWMAIVLTCALFYKPLGDMLADASPLTSLTCYMIVYVLLAATVYGVFALFKHSIGGKLLGSDVFGRGEYYLGMGSGMLRFACVLLAVLALLNARYFSSKEVHDMEAFQNDVYGSNYFPTWHTAQAVVFERSLSGPLIKQYCSFLLITPTHPASKDLHQKEYTWQ